MPKVTYHEYRPGRWVKMVDGEAVGPATAEEVALWQQEKAEQARIWQDVVQRATPASPPARRAVDGGPRPGAARADEDGIWQDVVGQAADAAAASAEPQAGRKTEPPLPQSVEDAVRAARRGRPVAVKGGKAVFPEAGGRSDASSATTAPAPEAGGASSAPAQPTGKHRQASPDRTRSAKAEPTPEPRAHPARKAEPEGEDTAPPSEPVMPKREMPPTKVRRSRRKGPKVTDGAASLEITPPTKDMRTAKPKPMRRRARTTGPGKPVQAEVVPMTEAPEADEPRSAEPAMAEGRPAAEPVPAAELSAIEEVVEPRPRRLRKLSKRAAKAHAGPGAGDLSADEDAADSPQPEPVAEVISAPKIRRTRPSSAPHRAQKAPPSPPQAGLRPAYLWVMSDAADNTVAAVRTGLARYAERFGEPAGVVLCHIDDLAIVEAAGLPVEAREGKGVLPRNFWIGPK